MEKLILFDGDCNFCDRSVQFIIARDPKGHFKFASLQSNISKNRLRNFDIPKDLDTMVLIEDNKCYIRSTAALRICKQLKGLWKLFYIFVIIPRPIRDVFYGIIAKNRYKWFGRKKSCELPSPEVRKRFLTDGN
ncbi:thiol-disulfide oxidoreductase DCC family protein [Oceanobacillus polygoni]|uniref:DCC family thiol-disulfide oxidoreductase YuxK n=1 Tax=Oceanobacillus polygoni TaxID=1235259 RepID=A0A9X0YSW9_9BACI|nr:DCC1-like thiol-disulfide oxidoreductase family protein [Oceanobacillus polygoni]MBP2076589.1 putative DCC family thiol-disulfide oxidoreductase YuxK [Oceanobacillus polygoni]